MGNAAISSHSRNVFKERIIVFSLARTHNGPIDTARTIHLPSVGRSSCFKWFLSWLKARCSMLSRRPTMRKRSSASVIVKNANSHNNAENMQPAIEATFKRWGAVVDINSCVFNCVVKVFDATRELKLQARRESTLNSKVNMTGRRRTGTPLRDRSSQFARGRCLYVPSTDGIPLPRLVSSCRQR